VARWRRAIELAMTAEEIGRLTSIARSRNDAARRVQRAQILLAYQENPSFFAVGQTLGILHQTVQRCVERAIAYGPLAALEDRPRPGKEPTITPEAKAWLISLACEKAKEHGYPHGCGRRGCWHAMHAKTHRPLGTNVSPTWFRVRYARFSPKRKSSRTRYGTIWSVATPSSSKRWRRFCVFIAKSRSCRRPPSLKNPAGRSRSSPMMKSRAFRPSQRPRPICRRSLASTPPSHVIMNISDMARSVFWPASICSSGRFRLSSEIPLIRRAPEPGGEWILTQSVAICYPSCEGSCIKCLFILLFKPILERLSLRWRRAGANSFASKSKSTGRCHVETNW